MRSLHCPAALLVVAVSLAASGCRGPGTSQLPSDIGAAPLAVEFGEVSLGQVATKSFELRNLGRSPLLVDAVEVAGPDARRFAVAARVPMELTDAVTLTVTYTPVAEGLDVGQVIIRSDARNTGALQVALSGVGVAPRPDAGLDGPDGGALPDAGRAPRDAGWYADDSGCPPTWATGTEATTYQVDATHAGAQPEDRLTVPLCERWRRDLGGPPGYAVVGEGLVFVAAASAAGRRLWALDQYTGATRWGPTVVGGVSGWLALALGDGAVFALSGDGTLTAFEAATGQQRWIASLGQCDSAPTAVPGHLLVSVHGAVRSLSPHTGMTRWTRPVVNGDQSSPSVADGLVTVSYACNQAYGFSMDGAQRWHAAGPCSGGGGKTTARHRGRVYTRDSTGNLVLDTATGQLVGSHASRFIPVFAGDTALSTSGGVAQAVAALSGQVQWEGEAVVGPPVVLGTHVVLPTTAGLVVRDLLTGAEVARAALPGIPTPDEHNVAAPLAGLSAANGMLFVPAGHALVAY